MAIPSWVWIAGLGAAGLALAGGGGSASASDVPNVAPKKASNVAATWAELGLPGAWQQWGVFVAYGESRFSITAELGKPGDTRELARKEHEAAVKAYQRLANNGRWPCPPRGEAQIHGSGGWYGQLEPLTVVFLAELGGPGKAAACDPITTLWQSPRLSTLAHMRQVRGTWKIAASKLGRSPTVLELRALYGLPSRDPFEVDTSKRRASYTEKAKAAGLNPSFLDLQLPPLPQLEGAPLEGEGADLEGDADVALLLSPDVLEALEVSSLAAREGALQ